MGGLRRVQMGGFGAGVGCMGGLHGWCRYGSVYKTSLRLGGRKLPTYELTLRLLGVATMYGWLFIIYP